ncbi:phage tail sheath subtilisin-like domain-containing protein (plasmid) [Orbus sturtevantii]|uniref:phage tail sheath subtilisin-like domain-containing protein n=1 Tax=Orbus sturtevantii TaxID=3074109 RepID=UPI00370D63EC
MIGFDNIPNNLRVPLFYIELDNSMANNAVASQNTLIIGQKLASGSATANEAVVVSSASTVITLAGQGSMLHNQFTAYSGNDTSGKIYILPLEDDSESMIAAVGKIIIDSAPTESGLISLYVAGTKLQLTATPNQAKETIAVNIAERINAKSELPVKAAVSDYTVTLTAKNLGAHGNDIKIILNYLGSSGSEYTPTGMGITIQNMSGGAGVPDLASALANLSDKTFDFIINPYTDITSLNTLKDFLSDDVGRWSYASQLYGHFFSACSGTYGEITTLGESRNDQHGSILGVYDSPTSAYCWSAAYAGAAAVSLRNDPGRPLQTLSINKVLAPSLSSIFDLNERNNLLYSGISTYSVDDDKTVRIENIITNYQKNKFGDEDDSYLQVERMFLLMFVMRYMKAKVTSKLARMKLAADGTRFPPGSSIVTPKIIKSELIAQYRWLENNGYVQGADTFAKELIVEINAQNPDRVDVIWPGTLISALRVFAVKNQFRNRVNN